MFGWWILVMTAFLRKEIPFTQLIIATNIETSPASYVDRQDHFYQRPMAPPSYPTPGFYPNSRPTPSPLPSTQSPESDRRNSNSQPLASKPQSHPAPLSPALHFHQAPANPSQPSPSLPSIFSVQGNTDLSTQPDPSVDSHHLGLPSAFSPSAFGLSPPAFLTDPSLNIAPTPPSHPQYATFPFDSVGANLNEATQSGAGGATALTPGAHSQTSGSHTASSENGTLEKDPFLSLLEQLAENEHSQGGPSELDFFLTDSVEEGGIAPDEEKTGAGM